MTGNGWAAAGMLRVLQTLNHSSQAGSFTEQSANLTLWIQEIITAAWDHQVKAILSLKYRVSRAY